jgi:alpha-glucoside transport system substrate-binding protein
MRTSRQLLLSITAIALLLVAAGCGSSASGTSGPSTTPSVGVTGNSSLTGTVTVMGKWSGQEQTSFKQVIKAFNSLYPNVTVKYTSAGNSLPTVLSTAVAGGSPPDLAAVPQPGLMQQYQSRGVLQPLDFAKALIQQNYAPVWLNLTTFNGHVYGLVFKGANKSTVWYNVPAFQNAGVTPPTTWAQLTADAQTLLASGVKPYSVGADVGWPVTDLFENIYLRTAGPAMYDKLANHDIPWTDPSVTTAMNYMKQIYQSNLMYGGTNGALQASFPTSVTNAYKNPPVAAMTFEGDFVESVITSSTKAKPTTGFDYFPFPTINGQGNGYVMGAGDTIVMFKDTPASEAFIKYLATPQAAEVWAKIGGFSSPNKNVPGSAYTDPIGRRAALALSHASLFRFDMSDNAPSAFGSTVGQGEWKLMTDFLKNPNNEAKIQQQLEAAATKAYGH